MKYIKRGETYYAMTPEQLASGRCYEFEIELCREPVKMKKIGYTVYNYEGTVRLTHSNGEVYFKTLKAAKTAAENIYNLVINSKTA